MKYYDISPELSPESPVFPGDQNFKHSISMQIAKGDVITLSNIHTTLHVGAHVDAPIHYVKDGAFINDRPLDLYMGAAQVIEIKKGAKELIQVVDLKQHSIAAPRVLIRTGSYPHTQWSADFVALSAPAVDYLASQGVQLIGIDTPSVDSADSKSLESHKAVARHDMVILEGIVLDQVPEGTYTLLALPLKIKAADASPVRAILIAKDLGLD